ncbi:MAG: exodeoxyribonuclease VII large subunit [Tannerellaceae bacterium]|jgi:exodeoxyribonuclease VII large subunit|nr:exodeoxyribonuclease VII large subunit [Tannerellaceae bacterium]
MEPNNPDKREELSLYELSCRIKNTVRNTFSGAYWVRAEMSDVRSHASGHCYLEFVEKHPNTGQLTAKMRASIWARNFAQMKLYFEKETGQTFASGLKVLAKVTVEYHELYGFNLNVLDIDPSYTVGDMIRKRLEIIRRLKDEGVLNLNKELPFPTLPRRIAVVTSSTAAGYEDFTNQLIHNKAGYPFYIKLFPALMQGEKTEASVIAALEHVFRHTKHFDLVVIIRGGGATSELSCFDSYLLATNCAQFPLPIVTGIGHERDDTVLDLVAHTRMKTPTAVAEFLIGRNNEVAAHLQLISSRLPSIVTNRLERSRSQLFSIGNRLPIASAGLIGRHNNRLLTLRARMQQALQARLSGQSHFLGITEQFIRMASPEYILQKGYTLTLKDGKIVKHAATLHPGDELTTRFPDGEVKSSVQ